MRFTELLRVALRALGTNALRSILTTLGIIIGVASVIVMVAVGSGARNEVERQIASLGTNILQVQTGSSRVRGRMAGTGTRLPFSEADLQAIRESVPSITAISGVLATAAPIINGGANWLSNVEGVSEDYANVRGWGTSIGRFFSIDEERSSAKVAVIGVTAATHLFGDQDPTGSTIRVLNVPFEIIGLLEPKGQSNSGRDLDDVVVVSASTARSMLSKRNKLVPRHVGNIVIKVADDADLDDTKKEVEEVLRKRRRALATGEDDFFVRDLADFLRTRNAAQQTFGLLLAATAAISLLVGGIGIMNIMLVSVSERTREIGLRLAIGARRRDILRQFLSEAIVLCLLGGLAGVAIGIGATQAIATWAEWPVLISSTTVTMAIAAAALTGICFGFLPARRASSLSPIEALRSE
jgi:putative ABC transport system permease protein